MPLEFAAWCKYIPRADPELDPTSIRASRELYFSARTTSSLRCRSLACPLSDWSTRKLNHSRSSTHSSVSQSVSQPVGPSVSRSVGRGQSCNRSVTHTVCHSVASVGSVTLCHDVSLTQPATLTLCTVCRSVTLYFRSLCHSATLSLKLYVGRSVRSH